MTPRHLRYICTLTVALSLTAQGQFTLTKVADTATPIPNGSGNFTAFTALYGPAVSQGTVAFYGTGANGQRGYYLQTNGVFFRAADTNTTSPGGGKFVGFSATAYGFESESLYFAGSADGQNAMFVYSNGVITKLLDTTASVPPTTNKFASFLLLYPFDGRVAFFGQGGSTSQRGIYRLDNGVVSKLADTNDNFIGGSGKLSFTTTSAEIAHDADGTAAFFAADSAGGGRQGIFTAVTNRLSLIASSDTTVPGSANLFTTFGRKPDLSGGKIVFIGSFSGGSGIFQANLDGSGLTKLVDTTTQIPGTNYNFGSFQEVALELGTVVFTAQGPGIWGAYRLQNSTLDRIVAKPGMLDGKVIDQVILSNQGLSGGRAAFHITFAGSAGIYSTVVGFANQPNPGGTLLPATVIYSMTNGFSFTFAGEAGRSYRIQYTTAFGSGAWTTLTNFVYTGPVPITDRGATNQARNYRAVSP